jgi:glycolate oxidase iron-sulfur subunit
MTILNQVQKPAETDYLNCIRCGLCLAVCPTYREYLKEVPSPRGRVALARKGLEGQLELTPNLIEQMYGCFACMACNEICPVGIRPADLALSMRHVQEQLRPAAWKRPLFQGLLRNANRMELATLPLRLYQRSGLRRLVYMLALNRLLPRKLRDLEAMLPHLPQRPLRKVLPRVTAARGSSKYQVGFFLGCAQSLLFAEQSAATVRVLARNHCTVISPEEIECCGMPARGYGRFDLVLAQAKANISIFEHRRQTDQGCHGLQSESAVHRVGRHAGIDYRSVVEPGGEAAACAHGAGRIQIAGRRVAYGQRDPVSGSRARDPRVDGSDGGHVH